MILYRSNIHGAVSHTQPTKALSQLIVNAKKKKDHSRHFHQLSPFTKERATGSSIYIGLNIYATARGKKMIKNFEQIGISISYDRVSARIFINKKIL